MDNRTIVIRGAREHNLRGVDLDLPRDALVVLTGVSGSGKSSLAFDTLFAEGQRRYVESLSSYARQFLGQLPKPDVDYLGGLSPAIAIQQKTASRNPRSTVGTVTEVFDFLRVLYARVGQGHCTNCGRPITAQSADQIIARVMALPDGAKFSVLAPVVRGQKGEYKDLFADMLKRGYVRARVDGKVVRLSDDLKLDRRIKHDIAVVIDRLKNEPRVRTRLADAVEQALRLADESLIVAVESPEEGVQGEEFLLSARYACTHCAISYEPPTPQLFSFNSPQGMCLECEGLGQQFTFDPALVVPDDGVSFYDGAIPLVGALKGMGKWRKHIYEGVGAALEIDLKKPWRSLPKQHKDWLLYGTGDRHITWEWKQKGGQVWKHGGKWEGVVPQLAASFKKTAAGPRRMQLEKYMRVVRCPACAGKRLNAQARAVKVGGKSIIDVCGEPVGPLHQWFAGLAAELTPVGRLIASELLKEIDARLGFLLNVGLHYLTLDRSAPTLSGGEAQRIRLAGQIGSGLVGVLYILDEPSIGLHPRDNVRLLRSLERLRDMGNTVLVVEHDEDTMRAADWVVDFGPGPGVRGGQVVAAGTLRPGAGQPRQPDRPVSEWQSQVHRSAREASGPWCPSARSSASKVPGTTTSRTSPSISLWGCSSAVTGVSGSGKSSLVNDTLKEGLVQRLRVLGRRPAEDDEEADDDAAPTAGPVGERRRRSPASDSSTRSSTSTSPRSAARRAPTRRRTSKSSTKSAPCSRPRLPRPRCAATRRGGSASTGPAAGARRARATARTSWRWTSWPTCG